MPVQDTEIKITDKATSVARNIAASFSNMAFMLGNFGGVAGRVIPSFNMLSGSAQQVGSTMGLGGAGIASMARFLPVVGAAVAGVAIGFGKLNEIAAKATETLMGSLNRFREFQSGLLEVQSILQGSQEDMARLGGGALDMSVKFGTTAASQLKGYYESVSSGFESVEESSVLMASANKLALAGMADLQPTLKLVAAVLNGFSMNVDQAGSVSDALFLAVKKGVITVPELAQNLGEVVPAASAAGASLEETLSAISALTLAGIQPAEAMTALAQTFTFLMKISPQAMKKMEGFGVSAEELNVKQRGLLPVIQSISRAFKGNEEALATVIPNVRAFRAIMPLAGAQGAAFADILGDMGKRIGATDEALTTMTGSLDFQLKRWAAFKDMMKTSLGAVAAKAVSPFLGVLEKLIDAFSSLPEPLRNTIFTVAALALAVPALTKGTLGMAWGLAKAALGVVLMTSLATFMLPQLILLGALLLGAASAVGILAYSFKKDFGGGASDMMASLKRVMAALKFAFEFISKGEISGAMVDEWDKTEAGTKTMAFKLWALWDGLKAMFEGAKEVVIATLDGMAKGLGDSFGGIGKWIRGLMDGSTSAKDFAASIPMEDLKEFGRSIGTIASGVLWLGKAFITVGSVIAWAITQIDDLYNWLKKVWENPFSRVLLGGAMSLTGLGLGPGLAIAATGVKEAIGGEGGFGAYPMTSLNQVVAPPPVHERAEKKQKVAVTINQNTKHTTKIDGKDIVTTYKDKKEEHDFEGMEGEIEASMSMW